MDRFTWGFAGGAVVLCLVALGSVVLARRAPPPDTGTPAGVVTAYVQAVRDRDADRAWSLLAPDATVGGFPPPSASAGGRGTTRANFDSQFSTLSGNRSDSRVRVLDTRPNSASATVRIEVTDPSSGPLFGGDSSQTFTFTLAPAQSGWQITTSPALYAIGG